MENPSFLSMILSIFYSFRESFSAPLIVIISIIDRNKFRIYYGKFISPIDVRKFQP